MSTLIGLIGCVGEAGLIYALVILLRLSRKLGEVTKMPPYYQGYYVAIGLLSLALMLRIVHSSLVVTPPANFSLWNVLTLPHHLLLAIGLTVSLPITFKYWGWLMKE